MLEQIAQLVRHYGEDVVVNNSSIPNEKNNEVMAEATRTITSGMQNMMAGGGLQDIISMFTQQGDDKSGGVSGLLRNPMVTMMIGHLISKLTGKFNMSTSEASQVSKQIVPNVLNDIVNRTTSQAPENDAFDLNDLIGSLGGNTGGFNFQDLIGKFAGGQSPAGGFDLQDIISQVTQGAQEKRAADTRQSGGGLGDLIKGLFGN